MNEFINEMNDEDVFIADIRKANEWNEGHFEKAHHLF